MVTTPAEGLDSLFSGAERCDRCSARARVLALLHSGRQPLFCGHHAAAHRSSLEQIAVFFEDPTQLATPPASRFPAVSSAS
jgi:hypothetical protein